MAAAASWSREAPAWEARAEAATLDGLLSELLDGWDSGDQTQLWARVMAFINPLRLEEG